MALRPKVIAKWFAERYNVESDEPDEPNELLAPDPDAPLTVKQAAKRFNFSARTLYALCEDGSLRHSRVGTGRGTIRINPADLKRLLANGSRKTGLLD